MSEIDGVEVNLNDFITTETTYRCQFCPFASTKVALIYNHVKSIHIASIASNVAASSEVMPPNVSIGDAPTNVASNNNIAVNHGSNNDLSLETPPTNANETNLLLQSEMMTNQSKNLEENTDLSESSLTHGTMAMGFLQSGNINLPQSNADQGNRLKQPPLPITKELFLCGQCSVGFDSIDECKLHMVEKHNVSMLTGNREPTQVSIGTQMDHKKKVGRKRKSANPSRVSHVDKDWADEYMITGTKSLRRIRAPKLKQDYFLESKRRRPKPMDDGEEYALKCSVPGCCAKFFKEATKELHIRCHNSLFEPYGMKCSECDEYFKFWRLLRLHLWKQHQVDMDLHSCSLCQFKADTIHKLRIHKETHSEDRPYACDVCGKGFKQFTQMRNHQIIHDEHKSDDQSKWYSNKQCHICSRMFANQKSLATHIDAIHNKVKPFSCHLCDYATPRKAMLQLHIRTHTGEKPHKCDVCAYATGDHNSLRRHKMRHTGQKAYKCQYCSYSCIQAISMKSHMKNKHPGNEGIYHCIICNFMSVNKLKYENHMKDHENGLISSTWVVQNQVSRAKVESPKEHFTPVQMQVQTMKTGEAQITAEDLARLSSYEGLVPADVTAAQLIYSALSAISSNGPVNTGETTTQVFGGVQTTITASSFKENVTTHTITFHIPTPASMNDNAILPNANLPLVNASILDDPDSLPLGVSDAEQCSINDRDLLAIQVTEPSQISGNDLTMLSLEAARSMPSDGTLIALETSDATKSDGALITRSVNSQLQNQTLVSCNTTDLVAMQPTDISIN